MLRKILHHVKSGNDNGCNKFCCTRINNFAVKAGDNVIFSDVNLHIHCGELTALIGPNGGGKSTLLKAVLGEIEHSGELSYVDAAGRRARKPVIGYVPQYLKFDVSTPTSVLDLFAACLTATPVWLYTASRFKRRVRLDLAKVRAEHLLERRLGALSGGEIQRVLLALALDPVPNLLLLDEPVSGVDQNGLGLFYEILSDLRRLHDMAIIIISHDFDFVERYADKVVLLDKRVICSGSPETVFADTRAARIFGMLRPVKEGEPNA